MWSFNIGRSWAIIELSVSQGSTATKFLFERVILACNRVYMSGPSDPEAELDWTGTGLKAVLLG